MEYRQELEALRRAGGRKKRLAVTPKRKAAPEAPRNRRLATRKKPAAAVTLKKPAAAVKGSRSGIFARSLRNAREPVARAGARARRKSIRKKPSVWQPGGQFWACAISFVTAQGCTALLVDAEGLGNCTVSGKPIPCGIIPAKHPNSILEWILLLILELFLVLLLK